MIPKERAQELVDKFQELNRSKISDYSRIEFPTAKQCALITADEMLLFMKNWYKWAKNIEDDSEPITIVYQITYWEEVKQEIEKL